MNIVHVGLPKTGTTTLQHAVFPAQSRFNYIGKVNNCYSLDLQELVERISFQDSLEYDPERAAALTARLHDGSKPLIVSDEIFSVDGKADRRLVAERLHRLFGPAKVLIGLRAQPSMLQALYFNYIRGSGRRVECEGEAVFEELAVRRQGFFARRDEAVEATGVLLEKATELARVEARVPDVERVL